jgi:hypothetical protein
MRLCCLVGIVDRSVFICCAKGKPETLKKILVPDTIFVFIAFATGTIMNIRDKHGADAYIQNTVGCTSDPADLTQASFFQSVDCR